MKRWKADWVAGRERKKKKVGADTWKLMKECQVRRGQGEETKEEGSEEEGREERNE